MQDKRGELEGPNDLLRYVASQIKAVMLEDQGVTSTKALLLMNVDLYNSLQKKGGSENGCLNNLGIKEQKWWFKLRTVFNFDDTYDILVSKDEEFAIPGERESDIQFQIYLTDKGGSLKVQKSEDQLPFHSQESIIETPSGAQFQWISKQYNKIPTTMTLAESLTLPLPLHIHTFQADQQTQGYGVASGSKWVSPLGNLYVTLALSVSREFALKNALHFPQIASAAVVKSMQEFGVDQKGKLQMKFVNDVFLNNKKVCGVLSKMESGKDNSFKLMIGIGVNLNTLPQHYPDLRSATSVLIETGMRISITEFLDSLTRNFVYFIDKLQTQGFKGDIHTFIASQMYLLGEEVKIYDRNLATITLTGVFERLNEDGTVTIKDS